ncbi:ABC transporter C family member 13 [Cercospora beticola]|uniref:ABC transporter C family member 13 n=2 Tax=Cercospora beticola TaxID=122368 RepID=A0A2G5HIL7_CERBT|nr:ABC transporter C family member 13 [Cercospora beticola]PIA92043.1 ABC transporter C family member 13 [Cercospora beticola]
MGLAPRAPPASKRLVLLLHRLGWKSRPLYSACDAAMSCSPAAEDTWGPVVSRDCLGGFDFTLLFEEAILTLAPLAIAAAWAVWRLLRLRHERVLIRGSWLLPCKLMTYLAYAAVQITLLVLASPDAVPKTRLTVACLSLLLAGTVLLALTSTLEHRRAFRPSTTLVLYLGLALILDLARTRTLFFTTQGRTIAWVNAGGLLAKVCTFALENVEKRSMLRHGARPPSPEAASGVVNRATFLWLNAVFAKGYRTMLTTNTLPPLDDDLLAASRPAELKQKWAQVTKSEHRLLCLFITHYKWPALAGVLPRLASAAFTFVQPYLIQRVLDFTSTSDRQDNRTTAYGLIGAYAIVLVGIAVTNAVYQQKTYRLITLYRGSLVALIFDKTLRMPTAHLDNAEAVTLMSADIDRITSSMHVLHELYASFIEAGLGLWLLYDFLGLAMVPAVAWMGACVFAGIPIARASGNAQVPWLEAIEARLAATAKTLSSIKFIKMIGMVEFASKQLAWLRVAEIRASRRHRILNIFVFMSTFMYLAIAPVWGFLAYILIAQSDTPERTLTEGVAFGALSIFELLQQPVQYAVDGMEDIQTIVNSFRRIQEYLMSPERLDTRAVLSPKSTCPSTRSDEHKADLGMHVNAYRVESASVRYENDDRDVLHELTFSVPQNRMTIIYGPVGSGKSTLLKLLLGELPVTSGEIEAAFPQAAYCSQKGWCSWGTIQNNIVGKSDWDREWYLKVISACALVADFQELRMGDQTPIGAKGSQVSGGQQARVSLARAIYSRNRCVLLDGVLTGLDPATEQHILREVFGKKGILTQFETTVVFATSSAHHLCLADHIIHLDMSGCMVKGGSTAEDDTVYGEKSAPTNPHAELSSDRELEDEFSNAERDLDLLLDPEPEKHRHKGDLRVWYYYVRMAGWPMTIVYLSACAVLVFGITFPSIWLQWWTNANATSPNQNIGYWLGIFATLGVLALMGCAVADSTFNLIVLPTTSRKFHEVLLTTTMNAPVTFHTSTDAGTTLNRFSQDLELIDNDLPQAINQFVFQFLSTIASAIFVFMGSGYIAAAIPVCFVVLILIALFYLRTSRQLRLLDIEAKAPLFSHFLETINGLESIRAYAWTAEYSERNRKAIDLSQRPYYLLFCVQQWLTLVLDLFNAGLAVMLVGIATTIRNASTAFLGVALFNIVIFSSTLQSLVTEWTQVEQALGAINRIQAYERNVGSEHCPSEKSSPPQNWPTNGSINCTNLTASYGPDNPPVLHNLTLHIPSGQKVAICGRTGSGKSSLIATLLRITEISSGTLTIDDIDISSLPREDIRRTLNVLPQEPFFFQGSVRENLHPMGQATDERCIQILQKVHLWREHFAAAARSSSDGEGDGDGDHNGHDHDGGENGNGTAGLDAKIQDHQLSFGQRRLFCLGRALIKSCSSNIILLDEPTSGLDEQTAAVVNAVIREEFADKTVVVVAHRLDEVVDFDLVVVLANGRVVETGRPRELLERDDGGSSEGFRRLWEAQREGSS